jgi:hypothetical protein
MYTVGEQMEVITAGIISVKRYVQELVLAKSLLFLKKKPLNG